MKVKLINLSVEDEDTLDLSGSSWAPPLGIFSVATYLNSKGFQVKIADSRITSKERIKEEIKNNGKSFVGFYTSISNYNEVLNFDQYEKSFNETVILGGTF